MARKKKIVEEERKVSSPSLTYKGEVIVKYKKSKKTIKKHNSGEIGLETCIVRALGNMNIANYLPNGIMGYYKDSEGNLTQSFIQRMSISSQPLLYKGGTKTNDATECDSLQFSILIPIGSLIPSLDTNYLQFENNRGQVCAKVDLGDDYIPGNTSDVVVIYWKMTFSTSTDN